MVERRENYIANSGEEGVRAKENNGESIVPHTERNKRI